MFQSSPSYSAPDAQEIRNILYNDGAQSMSETPGLSEPDIEEISSMTEGEVKRKTKAKAKEEKFDQEKVSTPTFKMSTFSPS